MPVVVAVSKPCLRDDDRVRVGRQREQAKRPEASVETVAVCDGLVATTFAPAIGAPAVVTTVPVMVPVVPARAG